MPSTLPELPDAEAALSGHLQQLLSDIWQEPVRISGLSRFYGGAARETWRFDADHGEQTDALVVRLDPPASLIDTSRRIEFHTFQRAHAAGLPVPEAIYLDEDGTRLGAPGFIMREIKGGHIGDLNTSMPYGEDARATGEALFGALGQLHTLVPDKNDQAILPMHDAAGRLAHWKAEILKYQLRAEPIAMAAIRWLEANIPPPSGPLAIIHGDFRSGNFLVDDDNQLLAILDWELAHLGDPYEDLSWVLDPFWSHGTPDLAAALLPRADAISCWEQASGRSFDPEIFRWWQMFAGVQALAIWISSASVVVRGQSVDPVLSYAGIIAYRFHNLQVATMLQDYLS